MNIRKSTAPRRTLGQLADALRVSRETLLTWERRGYFELIDTHARGEARAFDRLDVAYVAVFAALAAHEGARDAAEIMRQVMSQGAYWSKQVHDAISGVEVYVFVKRYGYKGVEHLEARLYVGPHLEKERRDYEKDIVRAGRQHGEEVGDAHDDAHDDDDERDVVADYQVGSAIRQAVRRLNLS